MSVGVSKRLISTEDYHKMGEVGILPEKGVELIRGEIINLSPIGKKHLGTVNKMNRVLHKLYGDDVLIQVQNPIITSNLSEPEPDLCILHHRADWYGKGIAKAGEALAVIEVADSSLEYDQEVKAPLYAESGIPEYWLVNLRRDQIERYTQPEGGEYKRLQRYDLDDRIPLPALDQPIAVQDLLLPADE
ncbi:MAG: Uma2 family endonuclease [Bacteroidetes bacterium]|jgi:Uma2 family endonuclease|nr:Uma2 family endonuclease [Bacteroidota bacterium]